MTDYTNEQLIEAIRGATQNQRNVGHMELNVPITFQDITIMVTEHRVGSVGEQLAVHINGILYTHAPSTWSRSEESYDIVHVIKDGKVPPLNPHTQAFRQRGEKLHAQ